MNRILVVILVIMVIVNLFFIQVLHKKQPMAYDPLCAVYTVKRGQWNQVTFDSKKEGGSLIELLNMLDFSDEELKTLSMFVIDHKIILTWKEDP